MDLSETIHLVGEVLGEVLCAQESPELFETEERIRALAKSRRAGDPSAAEALASAVAALSIAAARATASSFAVYFDLVNLAEEAERIRVLRDRERAAHPAPLAESVGEAVARLKSRGVTAERMPTCRAGTGWARGSLGSIRSASARCTSGGHSSARCSTTPRCRC